MLKCLKNFKEFIPSGDGTMYVALPYNCGKCENCLVNKIAEKLLGKPDFPEAPQNRILGY